MAALTDNRHAELSAVRQHALDQNACCSGAAHSLANFEV